MRKRFNTIFTLIRKREHDCSSISLFVREQFIFVPSQKTISYSRPIENICLRSLESNANSSRSPPPNSLYSLRRKNKQTNNKTRKSRAIVAYTITSSSSNVARTFSAARQSFPIFLVLSAPPTKSVSRVNLIRTMRLSAFPYRRACQSAQGNPRGERYYSRRS